MYKACNGLLQSTYEMKKSQERRQQNKQEFFNIYLGKTVGVGQKRLAGLAVGFKPFQIRYL